MAVAVTKACTTRAATTEAYTEVEMEDFSSTFVTEEVILDEAALQSADEDYFDPFHIGVATADNAKKKPIIKTTASNKGKSVKADSTTTDNKWINSGNGSTIKSSASSALPPRLMVKFKVHEEVSSVAHLSNSDDNEGTSNVQIEGTVLAQVVSSDALKNIPFFLISSTDNRRHVDFIPNNAYTKKYIHPEGKKSRTEMNVVKIPKDILGFVKVGKYHISQSMEHMPLLLEQKIVRSESTIQISIQVRSKLSNRDDLSEFSIVVFIPGRVNGKSVAILEGDGEFDQWKRCITWEMEHLPKGQSFMVSAKCVLEDTSKTPEEARTNEGLKFPVMLRCRSKDQISTVRFQAIEANGHPSTVSSSMVGKSYQIVHRLN